VSTSTSLFPDVNVWLAATHQIHPHHAVARAWISSLHGDAALYFCRFTQLGLLRLLTNAAAMGPDVMTQSQAWAAFDALVADPRNRLLDEPAGLDPIFRRQTSSHRSETKQWADGYLAAFASVASLQLVTFDRALAATTKGAILLS
jgi:uncharacterized protein